MSHSAGFFFVLPFALVAALILLCLLFLTAVLFVGGLGVLVNAPASDALQDAALGLLIGAAVITVSAAIGIGLVRLSHALFLSIDRMVHLHG